MAKIFLTHIDLAGNSLLNAAIQPSAFAPAAIRSGQLYYNTSDDALYFSSGVGTGNWKQLATGTTSVASFNNFTGAVTLNGTTDNITVNNNNNVVTLNIGSNVVTLSDSQNLSNKNLIDSSLGTNLDADGSKIVNLGTPTANFDAATKKYVDDSITNVTLNIQGTEDQIAVNDQSGVSTISLTSTIRIDNTIKIGSDSQNPIITLDGNSGESYFGGTGVGGYLEVRDASGNASISINSNGRLTVFDGNGNQALRIQGSEIYSTNGNSINIHASSSNTSNLDLFASQNTSLGAGANLNIYANDNGQGGDVVISGGIINLQSPTYVSNKNFYVNNDSNVTIFQVDPQNAETTIKGTLLFKDQYASIEALEQVDGNTEFNIAADYAIHVNSSNGNVLLEAPNGWAYVNEDRIITQNATEDIYNKTIGDNLHFVNGGGTNSIGANGNDLQIVSNSGNVNIVSNSANIVLNPDGWAYITSAVEGNEIVTTGAAQTLSNKGLQYATLDSDLAAGNHKITNLADPTDPQDAANKRYVDSAVAGLTWKDAVNLLANSNVPLTGSTPLTIDGQTVDDTYRVLLVAQTTATENGIYIATVSGDSYTLNRSADGTNDELKGAAVFVEEGSQYGTTSWIQTNHYISGFADQVWVQFSGSGTYTAGSGLELDGTVFNFHPTSTGGLNSNGSIKIATGQPLTTDADGLKVSLGEGLVNNNGQISIQDGYTTRKAATQLTKNNSVGSLGLEWNIEHNLNTYDIIARVYQIAPSNDYLNADVEVDIKRNSENEIKVSVAQAIGATTVLGFVALG